MKISDGGMDEDDVEELLQCIHEVWREEDGKGK